MAGNFIAYSDPKLSSGVSWLGLVLEVEGGEHNGIFIAPLGNAFRRTGDIFVKNTPSSMYFKKIGN